MVDVTKVNRGAYQGDTSPTVDGAYDAFGKLNDSLDAIKEAVDPFERPQDPAFTYDGSGNLTRIDYSEGEYKTFSYTGDQLTRVDFVRYGVTHRKDFTYTVGGDLDFVTESFF